MNVKYLLMIRKLKSGLCVGFIFFCLITYFQSTQMKLHEGLTVTESHVAYTEQGC